MLDTDKPGAPADAVSHGNHDVSALYRSEVGKLTRFFNRKVGHAEEAADLAHDVFVRFVKIAPTAIIQTPEAYLRRIADNILRDRSGRASTKLSRLQVPVEEGLDEITDFDQHRILEGRHQLEHYQAVLRQLKPKTLEIFILHRVEGLSYKQVGERLGMSEGGIKRHMMKAIAHLARARRRDR